METRELIQLLSRRLPATASHAPWRWGAGVALGILAASALLWWRMPAESDGTPGGDAGILWLHVAFAAALSAIALALAMRLGRPGAPARARWMTLLLPLSWLVAAALSELSLLPPPERVGLLDAGWRPFVVYVLLLCLPTFAAAFWCMRGQAPTRLALAGAAAGALAGSLATLVCTLFGLGQSMPPWCLWQVLGVVVPMAAGALLGPALLRW